MRVGTSALPPLHNAWLGTLTGIHDPPSEPKATCGDCVMCAGVERSGSHVTFSPDVKCCSYVPHLANFLVGRSLLGPGRESITTRIGRRAGVTPLGLGLSYADIRRLVGAQSHFGRSPAVVCPHFVEETQGLRHLADAERGVLHLVLQARAWSGEPTLLARRP